MQLDLILWRTFVWVSPFVILGLIGLLFLSANKDKPKEIKQVTKQDYERDWMIAHGQSYRVDEAVEEIQGNAMGQVYTPIVFKNAQIFTKWGFNANKTSVLSVLLMLLVCYLTIMMGQAHVRPYLPGTNWIGVFMFPMGFLVLWAGILDGVDGAVAYMRDEKSKTGAWLDAVLDRITDALLIVCLIPFMILGPPYNLNLTFLPILNVLLIWLFEYMRSKQIELGVLVVKPLKGERIARIIMQGAAYIGYGSNWIIILIARLVDPTSSNAMTGYFNGLLDWYMVAFQALFFLTMISSCFANAKWIWAELKKLAESEKKTLEKGA